MAPPNDYDRAGDEWRLDTSNQFTGQLDDIVVRDVGMFRMERMNNNEWWIGLYLGDASKPGCPMVHIDITIDSDGIIATRRED